MPSYYNLLKGSCPLVKGKDLRMKFKCDEVGEFYEDQVMCVLENEIAVLTNSGDSINVNLSSIKT